MFLSNICDNRKKVLMGLKYHKGDTMVKNRVKFIYINEI